MVDRWDTPEIIALRAVAGWLLFFNPSLVKSG
jgi:hypothetical protein